MLFLTPYLPSPPRSGGAARIHGLVSNLARRHEVAILAFARPGEDLAAARRAVGEYAAEIVTVENPHFGFSGWKRRGRQLRSLTSAASYERSTHQLPALQAALYGLASGWRPDAIVVEFAQMGYVNFPGSVPVILDAHNVEHELQLRMAARGSLFRRAYSRRNAAKLRREETAVLRKVDAIAATSEQDLENLRLLAPGTRMAVVPNGVAIGEFKPQPDAPQATDVLFFGALDYYPNADAVQRFQRAIWPRLRAETPTLSFAVVGREPPRSVRKLDGADGIEVVGQVDDLRPWIAGASAVVVPLRFGSGTRLKVLEALAMARPVVSTSVGVEGLAVEHCRHLLVADDPGEFAGAVQGVLGDPEIAARLGAEGRRLVEDRYDWRAISDVMERLIVETVEARRGVPEAARA